MKHHRRVAAVRRQLNTAEMFKREIAGAPRHRNRDTEIAQGKPTGHYRELRVQEHDNRRE
jgi:hypothetical protein